jgi:hypothetical protein
VRGPSAAAGGNSAGFDGILGRKRFFMIKAALKQLLNRLEAIGERDDGITDTEVREILVGAIYNGYLVQTPRYVLPKNYSLLKVTKCNKLVREA